MGYDAAFFSCHEAYFLVLKEMNGEAEALAAMRRVMERNLGRAYNDMEFEKGNSKDFVRVVGERDASVGLVVEFPVVSDKKIIYRFHTDPFPNLKGIVAPGKIDATYMKFKLVFLLGEHWIYRNTKHLWKNDPFTEFVIEKI